MVARILSPMLSFLLLLLLSSPVTGQQELNTFSMEFDGEVVLATQDIDERFLGVYMQNEGNRKCMFSFGKNQEESYTLKQTDNKDKAPEWNPANKSAIEWGALVNDGKLVYMEVQEYDNGKMQTYAGIVIIYKDLKTQTYKDIVLYQVNGNLVLGGFATKVTEMVSN